MNIEMLKSLIEKKELTQEKEHIIPENILEKEDEVKAKQLGFDDLEDLDKAISMLPAKIAGSSSDYGRIDQCFAKAWKAKTLLLKCSPQFNPTHPYDNAYWNEAYAAAKEAYDFCVANGIALTEKYADIWLQEQGPEVVFPVVNKNPNRVSGWAGSHLHLQ